jgi:hypothetical protein
MNSPDYATCYHWTSTRLSLLVTLWQTALSKVEIVEVGLWKDQLCL